MAYTRADKEANSLPSVAGGMMSATNINDIVYHLNLALHEPQPKHFFDLWRKERRATLNSKQIDALHGLIDKVLAINQKATQAQAELQVAPQIVKHIVENNLLQAQHETELMIAQHQEHLHEIKGRMDARKLVVQKLELERDYIAERIEDLKARRLTDHAIADKIRETSMTGSEIANIITSRQNKESDLSDEISTLSQKIDLLNAEITIKRAEGEIKDAEARKARAQANLTEFNVDEEIRVSR